MIQVFLSQSPKNPVADEASLALLGAFTDLEDFKSVDRLAARFAKLYPKSTYQDSFQYSEALANFHLGQYDRAIEVAQAIARATYKDAAGVDQPSPNKWQALYILGQIHDARRQPGKALEYYRQVADRFSDAAGAIQSYTRKDLKVPEVSVIRAENRPVVAGEPAPRGFRVIDVVAAGAGRAPEPATKPGIAVDYRNIGQVDVKVYPVDLMQLYLTRRNLNGIASIDLAGVTPLVEKTVALGDGADYDDKSKSIDLPLAKEGAYLTMIRGDNLYASGIVLVSPLEMEVLEEPAGGAGAHHRPRRSHQGISAQGAGQGDRQRRRRSSSRVRPTCAACSSPRDCAGWSPRSPARGPPSTRFTAGPVSSVRRSRAQIEARNSAGRDQVQGQPAPRTIPRRQHQDAEQRQFDQADRAAPAAIRAAGRQEQGSGRRRVPLSD